MTLLEIFNLVLDRMRESRTTFISTTDPYHMTILNHINDAKRQVEQAWDWSILRETREVMVTPGQTTLLLTESDRPDFKVHEVYNKSQRMAPIRERTLRWAQERVEGLESVPEGYVGDYWYKSKDRATGLRSFGLFPTVDNAQTLVFNVSYNQPDLQAEADVLWVPYLPVVLIASALASRERGEVGGTSMAQWMVMAESALADAIANDSTFHKEDLIWTAGEVWPSNNRT